MSPSNRLCRLALSTAVAVCTATGASGVPFAYHDYDGLVAELQQLAADFPGLAELQTAQGLFGLPTVSDGPEELETFILRLTNESTGLDKPEVLLVGVQHGDEVVSLEVALALARLLLESYGTDPWLTALVDRREIYFVPLANPWGFNNGVRSSPGGEGLEDMNRDHVYDRDPCVVGCQDADAVSTVGARALHELARRHLFRVMLDYHGGVELILHPWGSPIHSGNTESPDDAGHDALGGRMSAYGGTFNGAYPVGTATDLLGAVHGPLDDTSYAATWDAPNSDPLWPTVGAGALSYTVEISNQKRPPAAALGGDADLLTTDGAEDGYVPKNVRIGLAAIDVVEPWVEWTNRASMPPSVEVGATVTVEWRVRGCFEVDDTHVRWGADPDPLISFSDQTASQSQSAGSPCFGSPTLFSASPTLDSPGTFYLVPVARVDDSLGDTGADPNPPGTAPQSWLVRARTEEGLIATNATDPAEVNTVRGQLFWKAEPVAIEVVAVGEIFADGFESGDLASWAAGYGQARVTGAAAHTGAFGLEAALNTSCGHPQDLTIDSPPGLSGLFEACSSIFASGVTVTGPTTFRAGDRVAAGVGFSVEAGVPFAAVIDESLSPFGWVQDDRPDGEADYEVEFWLNRNTLSLSAGASLVLLEAAADHGLVRFQLVLKESGGQLRLGLAAREDGGAVVETATIDDLVVGAGWLRVQANWVADAAGSLAVTGDLGSLSLTGLSNASGLADDVRWGLVSGSVGSSSGSIWLDDFSSSR